MGTKLFGSRYDRTHWNAIKSGNTFADVTTAPVSSQLGDDSAENWGLVTIPAYKSGLVSDTNPLPVKIGDAQVTIDGEVNVDVSAFVSSNGADIDGAVTSYEGATMPTGPAQPVFIAEDPDGQSEYLQTDANKHLYTVENSGNRDVWGREPSDITSGATATTTRDVAVWPVSGGKDSGKPGIFGVGLYVYSGASTGGGYWIPLRREWLTD